MAYSNDSDLSELVNKLIKKYDDSTELIKELDNDLAEMYKLGIEISKMDFDLSKSDTTKKISTIIKKKLEKNDFVDKKIYKKKLLKAFINGINAGLDTIRLTGLG
jgi:hypothetical protein